MSVADTHAFENALSQAFAAHGHELYLVGGALRDMLLGQVHEDLDFATDALPQTTRAILDSLDDISVYPVGEKFGTIGAVGQGFRTEITTYRSGEIYAEGSRKPEVQFGRTIFEDLSRRDFTINAMARPTGVIGIVANLIDPYCGQSDLKNQIIRAVGEPDQRFDEDALRILRGVRYAAALDFEIENKTWESIQRATPKLRQISRERIAQEFTRMLVGTNPGQAFSLLRDSEALANTVPELLALDTVSEQGKYHAYSLWEHTFRVVTAVPPDPVIRWAALLHDIGKAETMTRERDGRVRFFGHEDLGAERGVQILESLRMSRETTESVQLLIATHMQLHQYNDQWSDGAVRRLYWKLAPNLERALALSRADSAGHGPNPWSYSGANEFGRRANDLALALPVAASPLNGSELVAHYGREAGPWVGQVKDALVEMVTDGALPPGQKAAAWSAADRLLAEIDQDEFARGTIGDTAEK